MSDENLPNDVQQPEGQNSQGVPAENQPQVSPEAETVQANQPSSEAQPIAPKPSGGAEETKPAPPPAPAPTKIGKENAKRKSNAKFLSIIGLSLAGLFVVFVVLMVLVIAAGGEQSPILATFGIDAAGIKRFLLTIVNLSFGLLALLFFVLSVIGVFKILFAKKGDKDAKKSGIKMTLVGVLPMILVMFIWLFLYNFIGKIEIAAEKVLAEITVVKPTELTGLKAPLEVTFSAENIVKSLQNSKLQVTALNWDFEGDGSFNTPATDLEISYLYNLQGNYNVGVEVTITGEDARRQYNYLLSIEDALFEASPASGTAPLEVQFDASNLIPQGAKVKSLDWDFDGDGIYELTGKDNLKPSHKFEQIGTFAVHLRFVDEQNLVKNFYRDVEITKAGQPLLSADIEATPGLTGVIPFQVRFDGEKSKSLKGSITGYKWDFGDGSQVSKGKSVSHVYSNPGSYKVTLTVTEDTGNEAVVSVDVETSSISSVPEARITTTPAATAEGTLSGELPLKISFDASTSTDSDDDIVEYNWDFGREDATQVGQKVDYTYEEAGTYTVTLTVKDSEDQKHNTMLAVTVEEPGVKASISADPGEGTAPLTVNFDGSASSAYKGSIVSYEWDFGDESPKSITSARISHKYDNVGTYEVTLKITTDNNESAETIQTIYVREIPLRACFEPSRKEGNAPLAVTFDSKCSTGAVSEYSWDFGDGETSDSRKPSHTFENPGTYSVTLEVTDDKNNVHSFSDVIVAKGELQ